MLTFAAVYWLPILLVLGAAFCKYKDWNVDYSFMLGAYGPSLWHYISIGLLLAGIFTSFGEPVVYWQSLTPGSSWAHAFVTDIVLGLAGIMIPTLIALVYLKIRIWFDDRWIAQPFNGKAT